MLTKKYLEGIGTYDMLQYKFAYSIAESSMCAFLLVLLITGYIMIIGHNYYGNYPHARSRGLSLDSYVRLRENSVCSVNATNT